MTGTGYRLPVPAVPAFTVGSVIVTRQDSLLPDTALFRHEARHATQYAWCGGLVMLPLYFAAAGASWVLSGDFGAWNVFERLAGLADGGYADRPLRTALRRVPASAPRPGRADVGPGAASETGQLAAVPGDRGPGREPAGHAGSTATASP